MTPQVSEAFRSAAMRRSAAIPIPTPKGLALVGDTRGTVRGLRAGTRLDAGAGSSCNVTVVTTSEPRKQPELAARDQPSPQTGDSRGDVGEAPAGC